jgi:hypothetical protein
MTRPNSWWRSSLQGKGNGNESLEFGVKSSEIKNKNF